MKRTPLQQESIDSNSPPQPSSASNSIAQKFNALIEEVKKEREELLKKLADCNRILGINEPRAPYERPKNEEPLKVVLTKILHEKGPMTKPELLDEVMKSGYKFMSSDAMNSINVILYTKKNAFRKINGGKFAAPK